MKLKCGTRSDGGLVGNFSHAGKEYFAEDGFIELPDNLITLAKHHGYREPTQEELEHLEMKDDARAADPALMTRPELITYLRAAGKLPEGERVPTDKLRDLVIGLMTGASVGEKEGE